MNHMTPRTIETISQDGILARNKVLRQTYILLGMNVLFSALCAYAGMLMNIGRINPLIAIVALVGLSIAIRANRTNGLGIVLLFALTGFLGLYIANVLNLFVAYGMGSVVVKALVGTGIIFFGLSAYVLFTGTNFTFLGAFLFTGLLVAFLAGLGAMFFNMTALSVAVSAAFLVIFSGFVLYDTSRIIEGEETNYISATLELFLDIFNIFVSLLNILSAFNRN
ncbi:Bax inhibitor-1 family protein [Cardiobacterium sp. Marseille-Q4385]|uniref:Bax inhibitor-1 family protein n=1 Tax=Cardiobacterium sp. Marseille-Q4385 TaxID=2866573 RepID=UPI001CE3FB43|nr:Bax inhibitor-1 family protein [Cardiobacterium sp. Marseille-Q4385]